MTDDILPIKLDAESVRFEHSPTDNLDWIIVITLSDGTELHHYTDTCDPLYEQLMEHEIITYDKETNEVVVNDDSNRITGWRLHYRQ